MSAGNAVLSPAEKVKSVEDFVLKAIHTLCDGGKPRNGVHVVESGLNGAMYLFFGGGTHPANMIQELIRNKKVVARLVKGGVKIYDPSQINDADHGKFLCEATFNIKRLESASILADLKEELSFVFSWTESARLCGGEMHLTQGRRLKGSTSKKGVTFKGLDKGNIKLVVQCGDNGTCYEYFLSMPNGVSSSLFIDTVRYAVENNKSHYRGKYELQERFRPIAEKALLTIMPDVKTDDSHEDVSSAFVQAEPIENASASVDLCPTSIELILLAIQNENFDLEKMIPKIDFTRILQVELMLTDPSPQVLGGLVKRLANPHLRIIKYVRGAAGADNIVGYMLTSNAKQILLKIGSHNPALPADDEVIIEQGASPKEETLNVVTEVSQDVPQFDVMERITALVTLKKKKSDLISKQASLFVERETLNSCITVMEQIMSATDDEMKKVEEEINAIKSLSEVKHALELLVKD